MYHRLLIVVPFCLLACGGSPTETVTGASLPISALGDPRMDLPAQEDAGARPEAAMPEAAPVLDQDAGPDALAEAATLPTMPEASAPETAAEVANQAQCCAGCQALAEECQVNKCLGNSCDTCSALYHACSQNNCLSMCP